MLICAYGMSKSKVTIILCNLIPRRLILVEVMFPIESTNRLDVTVQSDCGAEGGQQGRSLEFLGSQSFFTTAIRPTNRLTTRKCQVK